MPITSSNQQRKIAYLNNFLFYFSHHFSIHHHIYAFFSLFHFYISSNKSVVISLLYIPDLHFIFLYIFNTFRSVAHFYDSREREKMQVKCQVWQVCDFHFVLHTRRVKYNKKKQEKLRISECNVFFNIFLYIQTFDCCLCSECNKNLWRSSSTFVRHKGTVINHFCRHIYLSK